MAAVATLSACTTSSIKETDWPSRANQSLANEEIGASAFTHEYDYQLSRLWRDMPEYAALIGQKHDRNLRAVSAVAPKYPFWLAMNNVKARVKVSFIVGIDGNVEDARLLESSDSRFDMPAIEAIRNFKFIPAEGPAGPEQAMSYLTFNFAGRPAKAHAQHPNPDPSGVLPPRQSIVEQAAPQTKPPN
ncbi:MAG TPA: energy transducer TonB [Steroidobacteraceae bacterium]